MLRYALLAYLCLSAVRVQAELDESDRIMYHESLRGHNFENYLISPDTFGDRDTFLVAQYQEDSRNFHVELALFYDKPFTLPKECSIILKGNNDIFEWSVTSLRRLSQTKVLLTWISHVRNVENSITKIFAYDMDECREIEMPSTFKKVPYNTIVVPKNDDEFDVFAKDLQFCEQKFDECWRHYNLERNTSNEVHQLNTKIDWPTLRVERLSDGDFKVDGSNKGNVYRVFKIDHRTGHKAHVTELKNNNTIFNVVSSFCSVRKSGGVNVVDCEQVEAEGKVIFEKTVMFPEPIVLTDVRTIRRGELLLITKRVNCNGERDCWNWWATKVGKHVDDDVVVHKKIRLPCTGFDYKEFTIFDVEWYEEFQRTSLHYGCRERIGFYFGIKHIY